MRHEQHRLKQESMQDCFLPHQSITITHAKRGLDAYAAEASRQLSPDLMATDRSELQ